MNIKIHRILIKLPNTEVNICEQNLKLKQVSKCSIICDEDENFWEKQNIPPSIDS